MPWELAHAERYEQADRTPLDAALAGLVVTCRDLAMHLQLFLPAFAIRIAEQCGNGSTIVVTASRCSRHAKLARYGMSAAAREFLERT